MMTNRIGDGWGAFNSQADSEYFMMSRCHTMFPVDTIDFKLRVHKMFVQYDISYVEDEVYMDFYKCTILLDLSVPQNKYMFDEIESVAYPYILIGAGYSGMLKSFSRKVDNGTDYMILETELVIQGVPSSTSAPIEVLLDNSELLMILSFTGASGQYEPISGLTPMALNYKTAEAVYGAFDLIYNESRAITITYSPIVVPRTSSRSIISKMAKAPIHIYYTSNVRNVNPSIKDNITTPSTSISFDLSEFTIVKSIWIGKSERSFEYEATRCSINMVVDVK